MQSKTNNVIFIMVDSVCSRYIGNRVTKESCTPFIDKMISEGLFFPNVWSYGPYTDAATKGLYCSEPVLDNYGYYFSINAAPGNHFSWFHDLGYETYGFYYPYYLLCSAVTKDIDHKIFCGSMLFNSVWNGKLSYYANKQKCGTITELDYRLVENCVEMIFDAWLSFYECISVDESTLLTKHSKSQSSDKLGYDGLRREFEEFRKNTRVYIESLLEEGLHHNLAKVNEYAFEQVPKRHSVDYAYKAHRDFFNLLNKKQLRSNLSNNTFELSRIKDSILSFIKSHKKDDLRYISNSMFCLGYQKIEERRSCHGIWQYLASLDTEVDRLIDILASRDSEKPFYASIYALGGHHNISFFSYDTDNTDKIDEEIAYLWPLLDNCGEGFKGNLDYHMALRYDDLCVKRLVEGLDRINQLDDTTIVITSDHGSSFTYNPIRSRVVNTFHSENYNIPLIIWSKNQPNKTHGTLEGMYTSADVFPTLFDVVGLPKQTSMSGVSAIQNTQGRPYVITEYMGPGCPDMLEREVWIAYRDSHRLLAYRAAINKSFDIEDISDWYEFDNDPDEMINLSGKMLIASNRNALQAARLVKERFETIQRESSRFIESIDSLNLVKDISHRIDQ